MENNIRTNSNLLLTKIEYIINNPETIKKIKIKMSECEHCKKEFEISEMEADHIDPWYEGGETTPENCQMLCKEDNRRKSGK